MCWSRRSRSLRECVCLEDQDRGDVLIEITNPGARLEKHRMTTINTRDGAELEHGTDDTRPIVLDGVIRGRCRMCSDAGDNPAACCDGPVRIRRGSETGRAGARPLQEHFNNPFCP